MSRLLRQEGPVAVAVATTGADPRACLAQALAARDAGADLVELRADFLESGDDPVAVAGAAARLVAALGPVPVLVTVRTASEGGRAELDDDSYRDFAAALCRQLSQVPPEHRPTAVDAELERLGTAGLAGLVATAHGAGLEIVASFHDMAATPADAEILGRLRAMCHAGADLAKAAVTPRDPQDVARLLGVTALAAGELSVPVATMAMGTLGVVSRLAGGIFGSVLTFATAGAAPSAPGQPPIDDLRRAMELLTPRQPPAVGAP